ncbi:MAG: prepilin-type N-terminal cleavage/methylation domain-containing protein [Candidatus Acidiferrales bacterium]
MKLQRGFSLIELMVSMGIVVTVVAIATGSLMQAEHATTAVSYMANTQENLRAGMHFMVRDLMQAGEGIPQGGISLPYSGAASAINRPGTNPAVTFPVAYTTLPAITPGYLAGQLATSLNPVTGATLTGVRTDIINIIYADNILQDTAGNYLYSYPIIQAANPPCAGTINATGASVTLAAGCFLMPGATNPITTGNLMMFHNQNGTALEYVTSVAGQTINFAGGDPAGLNQSGKTFGTVANLATSPGVFPPTTVTRVWMVTYYIDATNAQNPQLIRQVNYPNYPAAAPVNPPIAIADDIENLAFSYAIDSSTDPAGTYGTTPFTNGAGNAPQPILPDTPAQIRAVNMFLAGRSENTYTALSAPQYLRNNLSSQVSIRSLSFTNQFATSSSTTAP